MHLALRVLLSPARGSTPGGEHSAGAALIGEQVRWGERQRNDPDQIVQIRDASLDDIAVNRVGTSLSDG
jgi:hypothetical protein